MKPTTQIEVCRYCGKGPRTPLEEAAPYLLEALEELFQEFQFETESYEGGHLDKLRNRVRVAIAKTHIKERGKS